MDKYTKSEWFEILALVIYVVFVVGVMSLMFGFGAGGFDRADIMQKNNFYIPYGVIFLIGLIACKIIGMFIFTKAEEPVDGAMIHDPEQSPIGQWKLIKNPFLLAFFCVILFGIIYYMASINSTVSNTFFIDIPKYEQQFTPAADLFFSVYPASPVETLGSLFLIAVLGLFLGYMVKKGKLGKLTFWILFIPGGAIVSMLYGIINHMARYGSNAIATQSVAVFWFMSGLMTTMTGSIIPALILHDMNNFFYRFSQLFSSVIVSIVTFFTLGLMIFLFLYFFFKKVNKKKMKGGQI